MSKLLDSFVHAIHNMDILKVAYFSKKEDKIVYRNIIPLDFGPLYKKNSNEFAMDWKEVLQFIDLDWSGWWHFAFKELSEFNSIEITWDKFQPKDYVQLPQKHAWHVVRDWWKYS